MAVDYPVNSAPGLWLRGLRRAGHLTVERLRVRARLVPSDTGQVPSYGPVDIPMDMDRAIVAAYAHPFVADAATTGPNPSDARVVRPVCAIRGPRSLEIAIPANLDGAWPLAMDGTLEAGPLGAEDHYVQEDILENPVTTTFQRPQRIVTVRDLGENADNPTAGNDYSVTLNSGVSTRVGPLLSAPAPGDEFPLASEGSDRFQVGSIGRQQERLHPPRNMYSVPVVGDDPDGKDGPLDQESNPDTVLAVRVVFDLPSNPTTQVQKVTLMSGQTVRVPITENVVVGKPLANPSLAEVDNEAIDPNEYAEFDVLLITANDADIDNDDSLAGLSHADPWAIFPALLLGANPSMVVEI